MKSLRIIPVLIFVTMSILIASGLFVSTAYAGGPPGSIQAQNGSTCAPLPPPSGNIVNVSTVLELETAVNSASSGDTIRIADGTYTLNGVYLLIDTPHVTLRSASGNREAVILDDNYTGTEIVTIAASDVTIADITIKRATTHPIHVVSTSSADTLNTRIYNVHIIDPGQQAIKINTGSSGYYPDDGVVACSYIELTDAGRARVPDFTPGYSCYTGGVDAHQARNWVIRDNTIEGFWCASGLAEHAIHMWRTSRDTIVERNILRNNARGVGFGLDISGSGRTYADNPCPTASGYVDHYGGIIRNNIIFANNSSLFASADGFDCGICLWNACNARALHNTIYTTNTAATFSAIEWRFANTRADIINNLVNDTLRERDDATATQSGNIANAQASWFVNAAAGDLHLVSTATSAIDHVAAPGDVSDDIDADARPIGSAADIGADEYGLPAPAAVTDLRVTQAVTSTGWLTATLRWTPPGGAVTTTLRYSGALISSGAWPGAGLLTGSLPGGDTIYTATIPYVGGMAYFALKTQNAESAWSNLSNNAFWPHLDLYLPVILKAH